MRRIAATTVSQILVTALFLFSSLAPQAKAAGAHWVRVSSAHFSVVTDAGQKDGAEVILRFEQMRNVFSQLLLKSKVVLSEPLDIIAFKTTEEYTAVAPGPGGRPVSSGTFMPGKDRNYILLDLSDENSWQAVAPEFARLFLRYNYPPTPAWFDDGFVEYFSSLQLDDKAGHIGGDPGALVNLLKTQSWIPVEQLFHIQAEVGQAGSNAAMFRAESWIVVHYLVNNHKLPETGAYFGLVENQKTPIAEAIQQAYGESAAEFGQSIRNYVHAVFSNSPTGSGAPVLVHDFSPLTANDVGTSMQSLPEPEGRSLVDEAAVRVPAHSDAAVKDLTAIGGDVKSDNSVAHRALAWFYLQKGEEAQAIDELSKAADRNRNDPWMRYYTALLRFRQEQASGEFPGLANIMIDLRSVIDWDPEFAQAYDMLAMARLQGGGTHSAMDAMRMAVQLSPRNQTYLLHLAQTYLEGKQWDDATQLLTRLQSSPDTQVASGAKQDLEDLPTLRKYGILPERGGANSPAPKPVYSSGDDEDDGASAAATPPAKPAIDRRKTEYLQGRLLSVDCSHPPVAIVRVEARRKVMRFRTEDYKSLLLIGADQFSCEWRNQTVVLNYKAGGKADGDLVSLEIR